MPGESDDWLEPHDGMGLWEYQLHPLNVLWLRRALKSLQDDLPVEVAFYDGMEARPLRVMHIDVRGREGRATAVVVTVG